MSHIFDIRVEGQCDQCPRATRTGPLRDKWTCMRKGEDVMHPKPNGDRACPHFAVEGLTPAKACRAAGLRSLRELSELSGQSTQTLGNWFKRKRDLFDLVLAGAAAKRARP